MIIGSRFNHDPLWVQNLQHDLYWSLVSLPYEMAKKLYLKAEITIGIKTELGQDCLKRDSIDHRVLQYFHDAIATNFRYESRNDFEMHLPGILDGVTEEDDIKKRWLSYYRMQTESILAEYQSLPRKIVIAATYPNPDERGKYAEDYINKVSDNIHSFIKENEDRLLSERLQMK